MSQKRSRDPVDPRLRCWRRKAYVKSLLAAANAARARRDWKTAVAHLGAAVKYRPGDHFVLMRLGSACMECGDYDGAEIAFRRAVAIKPDRPDGHLKLGRSLRALGKVDSAREAFAKVVDLAGAYPAAKDELLLLGGSVSEPPRLLGEVALAERMTEDARLRALRDSGAYSRLTVYGPEDYGRMRHHCAIPAAPLSDQGIMPGIHVNARAASPSVLRATLTSLQDQRRAVWNALVVVDPELQDHTIADMQISDPRIRFVSNAVAADVAGATHYMFLEAGDILDPDALGWLAFALAETGADAVYSDHDLVTDVWPVGRVFSAPALQPIADQEDLATTTQPPIVVLGSDAGYFEARREVLIQHLAAGNRVAHVPLPLGSRLATLGKPAAPVRDQVFAKASPIRRPAPTIHGRLQTICVIVPTRNHGALLQDCIESLRATAASPENLRFVVVDNRSDDPLTAQILDRETRRGDLQVIVADQPFNWSRLNNKAAAGRTEDVLVFANNDVVMTTHGWDDLLRRHLECAHVGVVGARLLYPSGLVQHAGIILDGGRPRHEGVLALSSAAGPGGRWVRTRSAAAVTGAFMAVRREVFERADGFEAERLAIAYNDIDFCLRVRSLGLSVLYVPDLEMVHRESQTRGMNDTPERVAWDEAELSSLGAIWGEAIRADPSLHPLWTTGDLLPFQGFRPLTSSRITNHIIQSARARPWVPHADI